MTQLSKDTYVDLNQVRGVTIVEVPAKLLRSSIWFGERWVRAHRAGVILFNDGTQMQITEPAARVLNDILFARSYAASPPRP